MNDLAELKQKVASCEQRILQLEADNRQAQNEIVALRAQRTEFGAALRAAAASLCPVVSPPFVEGRQEMSIMLI